MAEAQAAGESGTPAPADPTSRPPRRHNRRPRTDRPAAEAGTVTPPGSRPENNRRAGAGGGPREGDRPRDRDRRRDGSRDRRDGGGRGRSDGPKRIERKLYSFDSIVDRGFEDVEEEGGETRRVHWTIVKRTVADQITRKPMSQSYVLQRDGADSEFPNLGAARDAVHKKIVHPEKLTLSKAEHAAQKSGR